MSIGSATGPAQVAIVTRLQTDATLKGLLVANPLASSRAAVFDEPPEGIAFPYVVVGDAVESPANRMGGKVGKDLTLTIHAFSEKRGFAEVQSILSRIEVLLDNYTSLSVAGYVLDLFNAESVQMLREGIVRHGLATYRLMLVEA